VCRIEERSSKEDSLKLSLEFSSRPISYCMNMVRIGYSIISMQKVLRRRSVCQHGIESLNHCPHLKTLGNLRQFGWSAEGRLVSEVVKSQDGVCGASRGQCAPMRCSSVQTVCVVHSRRRPAPRLLLLLLLLTYFSPMRRWATHTTRRSRE